MRRSLPPPSVQAPPLPVSGGAGRLQPAKPRTKPRSAGRASKAGGARSIPPARTIKGGGVERLRRTDQVGAADLGQHPVERLGVFGFLGGGPVQDAFEIALAVDRERFCIGGSDARRETLPLRCRSGEDFLGFVRDLK